MKTVLSTLAVSLAAALAFPAQAASPYPVDGTPCANFAVSGSVDCAGGFANENTTPISNIINVVETETFMGQSWSTIIGGTGFTEYKDDNSGAGSTNSLINGNANGTVTFLSAVSGPFVLALKYGNEFSAFLMSPGNYVAGNTITFAASADQQGLSHAAIYTNVAAIPEPETYALMLAGLAAIGASVRRKNARVAAK